MSNVKQNSIHREKVITLSLVGACLGMLALYMYFVSATIIHVVIHKEVSQDMVVLQSEISELENEYIDAQHRVSDKIASLEGYREVSEKVFIDRAPDAYVLLTSNSR